MSNYQAQLQEAAQLAREGDKDRARQILLQILRQDSTHEGALMGLASVSSGEERLKALRRVLQINPNNTKAQEVLARLEAQQPAPPTPPKKATGGMGEIPMVDPFAQYRTQEQPPVADDNPFAPRANLQGAARLDEPSILAEVKVPNPLDPVLTLAVVAVIAIIMTVAAAIFTEVDTAVEPSEVQGFGFGDTSFDDEPVYVEPTPIPIVFSSFDQEHSRYLEFIGLSVAWSPDANQIAVGGGGAGLYDPLDRGPSPLILWMPSLVNEVAWSPNGKYIALGLDDGSVMVVDATGVGILQKTLFVNATEGLAWSSDSLRLAAIGRVTETESGIVIIDTEQRLHEEWKRFNLETLTSVAWSPSGEWIAVGNNGGVVRVFEVNSGERKLETPLGEIARELRWDADNENLWAALDSGQIRLYRMFGEGATNASDVWIDNPYNPSAMLAVRITPDNRWVIGMQLNVVLVWDRATRELKYRIPHEALVNAMDLSPSGSQLVTVDANRGLTVWNFPAE